MSHLIYVHRSIDDLGLSAAEFRVYAHLAGRRADNETGIAWPAAKSIADTCKLHPDTVFAALKSLEGRRLITREKVHGRPNRYRFPVPPQATENQGAPLILPSPGLEGLPSTEMKGHPSPGLKGHKGNPTKESKERDPTQRAKRAGAMGVLPSEKSELIRDRMLEINLLKHRHQATRWTAKEFDAFRSAGLDVASVEDFREQLDPLLAYYSAPLAWLREFWGKPDADFRRRELLTLLNYWPGEVDRGRDWMKWKEEKDRRDNAGRVGDGWVTEAEMGGLIAN